jgi:hypothetical protein
VFFFFLFSWHKPRGCDAPQREGVDGPHGAVDSGERAGSHVADPERRCDQVPPASRARHDTDEPGARPALVVRAELCFFFFFFFFRQKSN